jgi:hypothetical protein
VDELPHAAVAHRLGATLAAIAPGTRLLGAGAHGSGWIEPLDGTAFRLTPVGVALEELLRGACGVLLASDAADLAAVAEWAGGLGLPVALLGDPPAWTPGRTVPVMDDQLRVLDRPALEALLARLAGAGGDEPARRRIRRRLARRRAAFWRRLVGDAPHRPGL